MKRTFVALFSVLGLLGCATGPTREHGLVNRAVDAMGGAQALAAINTVTVKGTLRQWEPEQSDVPGGDMRFANESNFEVSQDRSRRATRYDWERKYAYPAPRTYKFSEILTPDAGFVLGVDSTARTAQNTKNNAHAMSSLRLGAAQREGLRGALSALMLGMQANPDRVRPAADINGQPALSYEALGVQYIVAFDPQSGLPSRVRTLDYDHVWGDVNYDLVYGQWQTISGVKIAMNRKYELNGWPVSDITFSELRINAPVDAARFDVPAAIRAGAAKPASGNLPYQWILRRPFIGTYLDSENPLYDSASSSGLRLQELAPGVQHVVGGTHHSLMVEMSDHLVVFDAPISDAHANWVIDAAKAKYPGKLVRYIVLTHHHMDHTGGVRAYLAQGATLVVGQGAAAHWRRVLQAPWTRNPDLAERDLSGARIMEVADKQSFSDGRREVLAYRIDNPHAKGYLMGYVPDAKLGWVTDIWSPGVPLPDKPNPGLMAVVNAVKKANIQPERFAGGHGSTAPYASLAKLAGQ